VLLRRRAGWAVRQLLYVSQNHFRHLGPGDWPAGVRAAMNATLAPDWAFHAGARALRAAQARAAYGGDFSGDGDAEERLARDAAALGRLRALLIARCGAAAVAAEGRGRGEFVRPCVLFPHRECDTGAALACLLREYDACLGVALPVAARPPTTVAQGMVEATSFESGGGGGGDGGGGGGSGTGGGSVVQAQCAEVAKLARSIGPTH
jgi:uncharacterized membrane protein YgcG